MKIYLDVSCLNRPFDDQNQTRIRLEAEAVAVIFQQIDASEWESVSSEMATIEVNAITDADRRERVQLLLADGAVSVKLNETVFDRASELERLGIKPADAVHIAVAEAAHADVFLSCDDRLCRAARRNAVELAVEVANPLDWLKGIDDDADA